MKVLLDAMGGDHAPLSNIEGAISAVSELGVEVILLGDEEILLSHLKKKGEAKNPKISVCHCSQQITMDEKPVQAIRSKKDSSLVKGLVMLKNKEADAFVSAGSTGALLAGGLFLVGRIKGIDRPALTGVYPTSKGGSVLLDIGANADCKPKNLDEFAMMGSVYASAVLGRKNPKVALINIGAEEEKGNELYKEAHQRMKQSEHYCFVGNLEAREVPKGEVDVMVCDGFTGNIILKLTEGVAKTLFSEIKSVFMSNFLNKLAGAAVSSSFRKLKDHLDSDEYGGAPLLGVNGVVIKAHGSSGGKAIKNAIRQAKLFHESRSLEKIIDYANNKMI